MRRRKEIEQLQIALWEAVELSDGSLGLTKEDQDMTTYFQGVIDGLNWTLERKPMREFHREILAEANRLKQIAELQALRKSPQDFTVDNATEWFSQAGDSLTGTLHQAGLSSNLFTRLINRFERIDWRYKIQLTIGICLAVTIPFYLLRDRINELEEWGYVGAFGINLVSSASIILPAPGAVLIAIMGQDFIPLFIGISAGLGGTVGGTTAYLAGVLNASAARQKGWMNWLEWLMSRFGSGIIFIFAVLPILPGDIASIIAGGVKYSFKRYILYNALGSVIKMTAIAYFGGEVLGYLEQFANSWLSTGS